MGQCLCIILTSIPCESAASSIPFAENAITIFVKVAQPVWVTIILLCRNFLFHACGICADRSGIEEFGPSENAGSPLNVKTTIHECKNDNCAHRLGHFEQPFDDWTKTKQCHCQHQIAMIAIHLNPVPVWWCLHLLTACVSLCLTVVPATERWQTSWLTCKAGPTQIPWTEPYGRESNSLCQLLHRLVGGIGCLHHSSHAFRRCNSCNGHQRPCNNGQPKTILVWHT